MGDFPAGHLCFTEGVGEKKIRQTIRNHILELPPPPQDASHHQEHEPFFRIGNPNKKTFICDDPTSWGLGGGASRPKSYLLPIKFRLVLGDNCADNSALSSNLPPVLGRLFCWTGRVEAWNMGDLL